MGLALDTRPLREYPLYRRVFWGQLVSFFGSQITYVALPWQLFQLTHSPFQVGLLGMAQLIPLVLVGVWGGAIADAYERRWICVWSEALLAFCNLVLLALTVSDRITPAAIYLVGAAMSGLNALHRPAFSSLVPQLVKREDIPRVSPLNSFIHTFGMISGPAVGGLLLSGLGVAWTYVVDAGTYLFAIAMMLGLPKIELPAGADNRVTLAAVKEGLAYARTRRDLWGTYLVDLASMTFAFPTAVYPLLASTVAGDDKLGWYYSATAAGALFATLTSGWTPARSRHGRWITFGAAGWGLGIALFGLTVDHFLPSLLFLVAAGWADMVSGIFRGTMWNQTIPPEKRGRLASVEMLSYASGPLLGNSLMGLMAGWWGAGRALAVGGFVAMGVCAVLGFILREFWLYRAPAFSAQK